MPTAGPWAVKLYVNVSPGLIDGWVMSDWGGTHSTVKAANNGLDQEQDITSGKYFSDALKTAVKQHKVPMSRLNDMVLRLMRGLFAVGVFDNPPPTAPQTATAVVDTPQELAKLFSRK